MLFDSSWSQSPRSGRRPWRKSGLVSRDRPSTSPGSVIFGDQPPPASARDFGLWRPGKKRLPQRIRQEVFVQREMAQLLEHIIDTAHFQDEGKPEEIVKEQKFKAPYREAWPTLDFPVTWAPEEKPPEGPKTDVQTLLQQSNLYSPATPQVPSQEEDSTQKSPRASKNIARSGSKLPAEEGSRTPSKRKLNVKKPAVPKSGLKQSASGWQHLRLAATALRPWGGISTAVRKTSKDKIPTEGENEEEEEEPVKDEAPAEEAEEEEVKTTKNSLFYTCMELSKQYLVPLEEVKKILDEFKQIDVSGDMLISQEEFEASALQNMGWSGPHEDIPQEVKDRIKKYFQEMDKDANEYIDFEEYFDWALKHQWAEEFLARDEKDLENRQLARQAGIPLFEVENYRQMFDEFDTDGSAEISQAEFVYVIMQIMDVKDARDIPAPILNRYWQEVDADGSGEVSFREFLEWMLTKGLGSLGQ